MRATAILLVLSVSAVSCSTTRILKEGQSRLAENKVVVEGKAVREAELLPYVRQQANSSFLFNWSPGLSIYNWSDGSDKGLSKFFRTIGQAPVIFDESLLESSRNNIRNHMAHLGYYHAVVSSNATVKGRIAKVRYHVIPGSRYRISKVNYLLPQDSLFRQTFLSDTLNNLIAPSNILSESAVEAEFARNRAFLRENGYYDIEKQDYAFLADTLGLNGNAVVEYGISRDSIVRYNFGKVNVYSMSVNTRFRPHTFDKIITIKPGTVFKDSELSRTYSRLSSLPAVSGVYISTSRSGGKNIDCDIRVSPAKPRGFKIDFEASFTSSGLMGFSPKLSYYNKNIFHGGEMLELDFSGNFQIKPSTGTKSEEFGVSARILTPQTSIFNNSGNGYVTFGEYGLSFNRQMRPEYTRNVFSATYGYRGQWGKNVMFRINPVQINYVQLHNVSESFRRTLDANPFMRYAYTDHIDLGLWTTFKFTTDNSIVPQKSYKYANLDIQTSGNLLSLFSKLLPADADSRRIILGVPFSQYIRGEVRLGRNWRMGAANGQQIALRLLAGAAYAYGNSASVPFEKKFYAGGAESMRGWQARALGPGHSVLDQSFQIPSQAGDLKLEFDAEYRFRMFWKLEGAVFAEVGNVWEYGGMKDFWKDIAGDWGLGLRLNLNFIIIRFDYGFKVHDPSLQYGGMEWLGPKEWFTKGAGTFHFGVGYPF